MKTLTGHAAAFLCSAIAACSASRVSPTEQEPPDTVWEADASAQGTTDAAGDLEPVREDAEVLACRVEEPCPLHWTPTQVEAQTPFGRWEITSSGMGYVTGLTVATVLDLFGQIEGEPAVLTIYLTDRGELGDYNAEATPGTYLTFDDGAEPDPAQARRLSLRFSHCAGGELGQSLSGALLVNTHDAPLGRGAGAEVTFEGSLSLNEAGWAMDIPISVSRSCGAELLD